MATGILMVDAVTGKPIGGVEVALVKDGLRIAAASTDDDGTAVYPETCGVGCTWECAGTLGRQEVYQPCAGIATADDELVRVRMRPLGSMAAASRVIVLDNVTQRPLIGVQVALVQSDGSPFQSAVTDASGQAFSDGAKAGMVWEARTPYHYTARIASTGNDILVLRRAEGSTVPDTMLGVPIPAAEAEAIASGEQKFPESGPAPAGDAAPAATPKTSIPWIPILALAAALVGVVLYVGADSEDAGNPGEGEDADEDGTEA